ncbi:MAG: GatB/YqeY domain-containing protein [Bacillales bacterium]|nr:GatB/YqeY domain-containing protein [Bacillales bacterium]
MKDRIAKDIVTAMKEKDKVTLETLRMVKGAIQMEEIKAKKELTDDDIALVIGKQIKTRKESIEEFKKGNREDLISKTTEEIKVLEKYMPEQLSTEEIDAIVTRAISELGASISSDMGKVMGKVTPLLKGKADMGLVSKLVKDKLN